MVAEEKVRTSIYLDRSTKDKAKALFKKYHISLSDAVNIFLSQSVLQQGLPFEMKLPADIELLSPGDPDYDAIRATDGEETISLEEFMRL